jgi:hypothetical protein
MVTVKILLYFVIASQAASLRNWFHAMVEAKSK